MLLWDRGGSWCMLLLRIVLLMLLRELRRYRRWETASRIFAFGHGRRVVNTSRRGLPPGAAATEGKRVITGQLPFATGLASLLLAIAAERRHAERLDEDLRSTLLSLFLPPLGRAPALLFWAIWYQGIGRHNIFLGALTLHIRNEYGVTKLPGCSRIKVLTVLGLAPWVSFQTVNLLGQG